jgi:hypothetical protein
MLEGTTAAEQNRKLIKVWMAVKTYPPLVWYVSDRVRFDVKESKDRLCPILPIEKIRWNI